MSLISQGFASDWFSQTRFKKLTGALALSVLAASTVACSPDLDPSDAEAPVPEEQAAVPESAEVGGDDADISELIGETVTVSTKITEVLSPNLFTIYDIESLRGEEVLAVTSLTIPEVGTNIEVTGELMELDAEAIRAAYNVELDEETVEAYTGRPYLAVQGLEPVD